MKSASRRFIAAIAEYPDGALGPHEICRSCVQVLPVDHAAITVAVASTAWETLGTSDDAALHVEAQQILTGEGPAVDAVARGGPVLVDDIAARFDRWPGLMTALGIDARGAMFAFPLQVGAISVGVLDLYRDEPGKLKADEMSAALAVTDIVTMVLLSRTPRVDGGADGDGPWTSSPTSREVHQATGMVVAQLSAPPNVAYVRLRAHAFTQDRPLIDVAKDVIARRLRFEPDGSVDPSPDKG